MAERLTRINAVVIGAGRRGQAHGKAARSLPEVKIAAVCDPAEDRAASLAEVLGGRPYADWRRALDELSPQLVYVTSPPSLHAEQTIAALQNGAHVVLEKPIALTMPEAASIGEAARRAGRQVQVCQQHRYGLLAEHARHTLSGRAVALAHSWLYRQTPDIPGNWDRAWGGGHVVEWGIHHLDLLRYLVGEIETVAAAYGEQVLAGRAGWANWDAYSVSFRFAGGAVGTMATTYAAWPGIPNASGLDLVAEGVMLRYRGAGLETVTPECAETLTDRSDLTLALNEAFVGALRTGDWSRVRITYPDAVRTLAVVLAANRANETGGVVRVADLLESEPPQRPSDRSLGAASPASSATSGPDAGPPIRASPDGGRNNLCSNDEKEKNSGGHSSSE